MYERIIIPLDGSKVGEAALPYVEQLVAKLSPEVKVEVTLLQVLSKMTYPVVAGEVVATVPYTENEMAQIKQKAVDYLNQAGEALGRKGIVVTARVAIGDASEEIVKAANDVNADLIAMSTHGRSGLSRWAFGSVTDKVLKLGGQAPILIVKGKEVEE
ncbi:universal stress protein [Chloroflexota bacterium]